MIEDNFETRVYVTSKEDIDNKLTIEFSTLHACYLEDGKAVFRVFIAEGGKWIPSSKDSSNTIQEQIIDENGDPATREVETITSEKLATDSFHFDPCELVGKDPILTATHKFGAIPSKVKDYLKSIGFSASSLIDGTRFTLASVKNKPINVYNGEEVLKFNS